MDAHVVLLTETTASQILLVEDDPDLRELLAVVLADDGYEVEEMPDGRRFVEWLGQWSDARELDASCQLIITDVRMPGYSGLEALERLRHSGSKVPVIVMTACADETTRRRALNLGAAAILDKPFDLDRLRAVVPGFLRGSPANEEGQSPEAPRQAGYGG